MRVGIDLVIDWFMLLSFESLKEETAAYAVEPCQEGVLLVRKPGAGRAFDDIARRTVDHAGDGFAAFPRADGRGGYDSVLIVPFGA